MAEDKTAEAGGQSITFEQFETARAKGETPVLQAAEPEKKPAESGAPEGEPKAPGDTESPTQEEEQDPKEGEEPKWYQRRIARFTRQKYELQSEIEGLKAQLSASGARPPEEQPKAAAGETDNDDTEPVEEDFDTTKEYIKALASWQYRKDREAESVVERQRKEKEAEAAKVEAWNKRASEARKKYDDFDQVIDQDIPIHESVQRALLEADQGAELAYWLGKHPDEARRIAALSPLAAVKELGKIEASLAKESDLPQVKPKSEPSSAPKPPKTVAGKPPASTNPVDATDFTEFSRRREAQLRS